MINIGAPGLFTLDALTGKRASAARVGVPASAGTLISRMPSLAGGVPNSEGWSFGALSGGAITVENDDDGLGPYLRAAYPAPIGSGANYIYGGYELSELKQDIYIQMSMRMAAPRHGFKCLKLFGYRNGSDLNYANTTFGADYTGIEDGFGSLYQVSFGDGTTLINDTDQVINYNGNNPAAAGRSYPGATISAPVGNFTAADWGSGWHKFQFRAKFNSGTTEGTEVADGAYDVVIDDVVYIQARGLLNRNVENGFWQTVGIFGYSQNGDTPFNVDMRSATVSENGWVD